MKKVNWRRVIDFIFDLCFVMLMVFGFFGMTMFAIYLHDKSEPAKFFMFVGFGIIILSVLGMITIPIIDFFCERKKSRKQKDVSSKVVIREDIVV